VEKNAGDALRRAALRRQAAPNSCGSPLALEVSLAKISAEVTAEAIERRNSQPQK
jgi:hypothetical protein